MDRDYYLVTSSFEYFPGIPIYHSRDLVSWQLIGHCLTRTDQLDLRGAPASGGIFAATIRHHADRFYVTATNVSDGGHFIVQATDPAGPWTEPVWVAQNGIDPSLYFEDGTAYFTSTIEPDPGGPHEANPTSFVRGIQQSTVDVDTGRILSEPRLIWTGTGGQYPEGPHLYRVADHYILMISEGGTGLGHMVTVARSKSPWGPFEAAPHNPVLSHRSTSSPIQATGHGDLVQAHDGSWWIVCLGTRPVGFPPCHHLGRETFLAPVRWTDEGWPIIGDQGRIAEVMGRPRWAGDTAPWSSTRDDFDDGRLDPAWSFIRNPEPDDWSLASRPGWLRLRCSAITLSDGGSPAFVGRRQQHFAFAVRALMEFDPQQEGEEAGLTVRMNERHHYEIGVDRAAGQRRVIVRQRIGELERIDSCPVHPLGALELDVSSDGLTYRFAWSQPNQPATEVACAEVRYLSSEVAGGFTGVSVGMYATGTGRRGSGEAYWDWFEYEARDQSP